MIEYKQGFVNVKTRKWESGFETKIPKILCALANSNPGTQSYLVFGVCDGEEDKKRIEKAFKTSTYEYHGWYICGVDKDIHALKISIDDLFGKIRKLVDGSELSDSLKKEVISGIRILDYSDRQVLVINVPPRAQLSFFGDDCFVRSGSDLKKLSAKEVANWSKEFA